MPGHPLERIRFEGFPRGTVDGFNQLGLSLEGFLKGSREIFRPLDPWDADSVGDDGDLRLRVAQP